MALLACADRKTDSLEHLVRRLSAAPDLCAGAIVERPQPQQQEDGDCLTGIAADIRLVAVFSKDEHSDSPARPAALQGLLRPLSSIIV